MTCPRAQSPKQNSAISKASSVLSSWFHAEDSFRKQRIKQVGFSEILAQEFEGRDLSFNRSSRFKLMGY